MHLGGVIQDVWQVDRLPEGPVRIYPDGCQDVIWVQPRHDPAFWKVATLDTRVRVLSGAGGAALWGARLAPGAQIPTALFQELPKDDPASAATAIAALCKVPVAVDDWLMALRRAPVLRVSGLARSLGVSARTLQRQILSDTGQSPLFWLRLLRLRIALAEARDGVPLAEAAAGAGFSDQAHFSREAVVFHGKAPARLLRDDNALAGILASGL